MGSILKLTARSIKSFFGRFVALLLIVALSVGFFAGLKVSHEAMQKTASDYLERQNFYDYKLMSTLGYTEDDVTEMGKVDGVKFSEGSKSLDAMVTIEDSSKSFTLISLPENVNKVHLTSGRMPEKDNEVLLDNENYDEDAIGKTVKVDTDDGLEITEFTVVGICDSPIYMGSERGTTNVGNGSLSGFLYLKEDVFTSDIYTSIYIKLDQSEEAYSDAYDDLVDKYEDSITDKANELADARYDDLVQEVKDQVTASIPAAYRAYMLEASINETVDKAVSEAGIEEATVYVLTRDENTGYLNFDNDTSIVSAVANIMPFFFIMIALLVCVTTMSRMVDEERTQIGTLKAMGFSNTKISLKYALYAGIATFIGWAIGYFAGTYALPKLFWYAYGVLYDFAEIEYVFEPLLAVLSLLVSLVAIIGSALITCRKELLSQPSELIRPKAPKSGSRIFLEKLSPLWSRLNFLQKVTLRNLFRYKGRLIMMIIGIGCCTGLVLTAFGIRDSMIHLDSLQYDDIQTYNLFVSYEEGKTDTINDSIIKYDSKSEFINLAAHRVDAESDTSSSKAKATQLLSFDKADANNLKTFLNLLDKDGNRLELPQKGNVLICQKVADKLEASVGDKITLKTQDGKKIKVEVAGIFVNYLDTYIVSNTETVADCEDELYENSCMVRSTKWDEMSELLIDDDIGVSSITRIQSTRDSITSSFECLNYIIFVVIGFAAALAFIVIYNLTNINLAERRREIATVEVLGFRKKETESYILKENIAIAVVAGIIGLPLGVMFHRFVLAMIILDNMTFPVIIRPLSYLLAFLCTLLFAWIVNLVMKRNIAKIDMAESLKAVE